MSQPPPVSPDCSQPSAGMLARRGGCARVAALAVAALLPGLLASCSSSPFSLLKSSASEAVVYALGPREGFNSPLNANLQTACPALVFGEDELKLNDTHAQAVHAVYASLKGDKKARLIVAGYAPPSLPADHARSLSERRAQAVRQRLVELGADPANVQTVGFGNDFSFAGPSSSVVVIYRQ